jgi:hypothetical protein
MAIMNHCWFMSKMIKNWQPMKPNSIGSRIEYNKRAVLKKATLVAFFTP